MGQSLEIKAFAKINLTFRILKKQKDGYHEISSVFQAVDLYDLITISQTKRESFLTGSIVCSIKENLIIKTLNILENFIGRKFPSKIHLIKNIPIAAGLGGGSSDAAAVLVGLNKFYSLKLDFEKLSEIGLKIGSDVPFFIKNYGTALVGGIGDKIKPSKQKLSKFYVLARPHQRISTAWMYKLFDKRGKSFLELAEMFCPDVKKIYNYFSPLAKECGMSGSGPTIFAGFDSCNKALRAVENFGIEKFNGDFYICRPSRKTYEIT